MKLLKGTGGKRAVCGNCGPANRRYRRYFPATQTSARRHSPRLTVCPPHQINSKLGNDVSISMKNRLGVID